MVMMAGFELPIKAIRQQISSAVHLFVNAARLSGGPRKIMSVTEIQGMEGDTITLQELFKFEQLGIDSSGKAFGHHIATGLRSGFIDELKAHGEEVDPSIFERRVLMSDVE